MIISLSSRLSSIEHTCHYLKHDDYDAIRFPKYSSLIYYIRHAHPTSFVDINCR